MQTLVYIIGGYCLIKGVLTETLLLWSIFEGDLDREKFFPAVATTAFLFLAAIEAFNQ